MGTKSYDYLWAREVYETFRTCLPAGCRIVEQMYNMDDFFVIELLCRRNRSWQVYKNLVKNVQNLVDSGELVIEEWENWPTERYERFKLWLDDRSWCYVHNPKLFVGKRT